MSFVNDVAQRSRGQQHPSDNKNGRSNPRQSVQHSHSSLEATGHWIHLLAIAAPLVIDETIKDPDKRWRALRLASVGAAIASEIVWTHRLATDKQKDKDTRAALTSCADRGM